MTSTKMSEPSGSPATTESSTGKTTTETPQESVESKPELLASEQPQISVGMLAEAKSLYYKKESDGNWRWGAEEPKDVPEAVENEETAKFAFLVRRKRSNDSRKKYDIHSVIVQSPLLKEVLGDVLKDYPGITTKLDRLVFNSPFQPFVHRWNKLEELLAPEKTTDDAARQHLRLFRDTLFEELKQEIAAKDDLIKNRVITFEYLWTIFEPGVLVYSVQYGKPRVYQLISTSKEIDRNRGMAFLRAQVLSIDWDGTKFGFSTDYLANYEFEGTTEVTSLKYYPLDFSPMKEEIVQELVLRGQLFERFAGFHYQAYKGVALIWDEDNATMVKRNLDGRIAIDSKAYYYFNSNQAGYLTPLGREGSEIAKFLNDSNRQPDDEANNDGQAAEDYDDFQNIDYNGTDDSDSETVPLRRRLSENELLLTCPHVRGYSIRTKKWFWFFVDQISDIEFAEDAFDKLVLPPMQKHIINAFVDSRMLQTDDEFDDVIEGKGKGMIMLLAGPPGVGKTLTAESVAEKLQTPLYSISAGDFGTEVWSIEENLRRTFEMVSRWNGVVLLDEADVFLEARNTSDLDRNRLVSVFLRLLEYFQGTMFLTTNRVQQIDPAFHSRIHVTIHYPELSKESRSQVWKTFLEGNRGGVTDKEIEGLAEERYNGRQIKNLVKTARMLARSERKAKTPSSGPHPVQLKHIQTVIAIDKATTWT